MNVGFYPHDAMLAPVTSYGTVCACLSVCHKSVLYRAAFWHVGFFRPILHCALRIFTYLQETVLPFGSKVSIVNSGLRPRHIDRRNVLST